MSHIDDLIAARDRYSSELANRQGPPDVRWDEYERFVVEQIERLNDQIRAAMDSESATMWRISQAATD